MLALLLDSSIRATLMIALAAILLRLLRIRSASVRHAIWAALTATMLLLPIIVAWAPSLSLPILPGRPIRTPVIVQMSIPSETTALLRTPNSVAEVPTRSAPVSWQTLALGIYLAGAVLLLLRLAVGTYQVRRLVAGSTSAGGRRTHPSCAAPVTIGWLRPVVILPVTWSEWPEQQLHAVETHEEQHVRRRDPLLQWITLLNRAIFWFHPLAWWLERELATLAEEACDESVLAQGIDSVDYSNALLFLARTTHETGERLRLGMAMPGPGLSSRLHSILEGALPQRLSRTRLACVAMAVTAVAFTLSTGKLVQAQSSLAFEVAAIKLHKDQGPRRVGVQIQGTEVIVYAMTLRNLVTYAYEVRNFQAEGGEKWTYADGDRYDITARAPGGTAPTEKEVRAMILALLKERFKLQERRSSKEMPVYALTVSPKGHHLKPAEMPDGPPAMFGANGSGREGISTYKSAPAGMLATSFFFPLDRPIVDQTGLTGKYDYALKLTSSADGTITGPSGESLFTAIEEQLGLKLEPKSAQVELIVIDQAERPTEN